MDDPRPRSSATVRRYATRVRARGAGEVASELLGAIRSAASSRGVLSFLTRPTADSAPDPAGLMTRHATPADAERYAVEVGTDSPHSFRGRLSPHTHCYLVLDGQRILHASWVTTTGAWVGELRRYFIAPGSSAYVYESFTHPDARGRGIYPAALRHIASDAAADGLGELWIGVGDDNRASIRAIAKASFVPAFDVSFSRRLGRVRIEGVAGPRSDEAADILRRTWSPMPMVR